MLTWMCSDRFFLYFSMQMANKPPFLLTTERYEGHYRDPRVQQDPPTNQSHGRPRWGGPVNQGERLL